MDPTAALKAFTTKKNSIDRKLERLKTLSDNCFNLMPEQVNFSHVGNLSQYESLLTRITDMAFSEGEHAK